MITIEDREVSLTEEEHVAWDALRAELSALGYKPTGPGSENRTVVVPDGTLWSW